MRFILGFIATVLLLSAFTEQALASDGTVIKLTGQAFLTHDGKKVPLKANTEISLGDVIETQNNTHVEVEFIDGTNITIGSNGILTIDDFVYDAEGKKLDKARFSILRTAFIYLSGTHDEKAQPDVAVKVDFGSIGIRGTKLYRGMRDGKCWIYLEDGAITVSNKAGISNLSPGQLTTMSSLTKAPSPAVSWTAEDLAWIKTETGAE